MKKLVKNQMGFMVNYLIFFQNFEDYDHISKLGF
jgi:hypothetical protein